MTRIASNPLALRRSAPIWLLMCGAAMVSGTAAMAQSAAAPADTAEAPAEATIVVTAQRRSEDTLKVPVSVAVLKSDALTAFHASGEDTLLSLSGKVPDLYAETSTGRIFPRFYIRGLGNIDFYLGASQPVSLTMDDVVEEHVVLKSNPAFDIAEVEVLRGPQGSLFGRNTTAGIIKFDTVQPSATWQGQGSVSWGTYNSVNAEAGIGGSLSGDDKITFRLSALDQHRDNWISNTYTGPSDDGTVGGRNVMGGFDERDVRLQVLFKPADRLAVRLSGHARDYSGNASIFYRGSIAVGTNAVPATFNQTQVAYDEAQNNPQAYKTRGVSLKADYDADWAKLTAITAWESADGYSRGDTDGGAAANFGGVAPNYCAAGCGQSQGRLRNLDQWSQELRLASPDKGPFKWQIGALYFDSRDQTEFDQRAFFLTSNALGTTPNPNNWVLLHDINTSWAVFGQGSYDLTHDLTLTAGVRATNDTKSTFLEKTANTVANVSTFTGVSYVRLSDTQPSWDLALLYRVSPDVSLYARAARGFRGPTIQGRSAVFNTPFTTANSEKNTSGEAGIKTAFWGNRAHFNLTGFYYQVKDIQLNGNDSNGNGVLFNANKAVGYGTEAEFDAHPLPGLKLNVGFSLLHTEIDDPNVFAQVGSAGGVVSETVLNPLTKVGSNYYAQINGNPLPNAPHYNLNIGARYDLPVGPGKAFVAGDFNKQGYTSFVLYKTVEYTANGNYELGARIGYEFGRYQIAAFARNLTNQHNLVDAIDTSNYRAGIYNDPRTFGVALSGSFR